MNVPIKGFALAALATFGLGAQQPPATPAIHAKAAHRLVIKNAMVIMKMRGSAHDKRLIEYEITAKGIHILAPFSEYAGIMTGSPTRSSSEKFVELFKGAVKKK